MSRLRWVIVGFIVIAAGGLAYRYRERVPGLGLLRRAAPNVLVISIDTLRADHLGCYGDATPRRRASTRSPPRACASQTRSRWRR